VGKGNQRQKGLELGILILIEIKHQGAGREVGLFWMRSDGDYCKAVS
jgi:hypothetical protein